MKATRLLRRLLRRPFVYAIPVVVLFVTGGLSIRLGASSSDENAPPLSTAAVNAPSERAEQLATATPVATSTSEPTPTVAADRTDCEGIRGTAYRSGSERDWFLGNCVVAANNAIDASRSRALAPTTGNEGGLIRGSSDRLVIKRLGINAPVNYRLVEPDGVMGNPVSAWDVVWYDFSNLPGLGGYAGGVGNAVYAGHVDYRSVGPAVFWNLKDIAVGDIIEIYANGELYRYAVDWFADYTPDINWNAIVATGSADVVTLITCIGTFDYQRGEYSNRRAVRASRIQ